MSLNCSGNHAICPRSVSSTGRTNDSRRFSHQKQIKCLSGYIFVLLLLFVTVHIHLHSTAGVSESASVFSLQSHRLFLPFTLAKSIELRQRFWTSHVAYMPLDEPSERSHRNTWQFHTESLEIEFLQRPVLEIDSHCLHGGNLCCVLTSSLLPVV